MRSLHLFLLALCLGLLTPGARAQQDQEQRLLASKIAQQATDAFERKDYAKAESLLRRQLVLQPGSFIILYNLGCARALQDDPPGATEFIIQAVEHGFSDLSYLERDPQLASIQDQPSIRGLRARWSEVLKLQANHNLEDAQRTFQKGYQVSRDERLKIIYLSAFNPKGFESVKTELARIADWAQQSLWPDLLDDKAGANDAWVVVVLPGKSDFSAWATASFGSGAVQGNSMIAGSYMHDQKRLVAMDLGATLRHEFLHALHWRIATRRGQSHPLWILEGLGTLIEDYDLDEQGHLTPATSWRTNTTKRIEKVGKLIPIAKFAAMNHTQFSSQRPLANYAQARALFLYLAQRDALRAFFTDYADTYAADRSGLAALGRALHTEPDQIDAAFRAWVKALPAVPEEIKPGMASLGVEVESGAGDGPVIAAPPRRADGSRIELRLGDVIQAIDDKPVRDLAELVRVLSTYTPGDAVTVSYRRGTLLRQAPVTLLKAP